jgi:hypothetical protein
MMPFDDTAFYASADLWSPIASAVTVSITGVLGLLVMLVVSIGERRQALVRAKAAMAAEKRAEQGSLTPGYAVVHGEVETVDGGPAVQVTIRQSGREYRTKGGLRHIWTEFGRESIARPFTLRTSSGERVKVEPGNEVLLVDWLGVAYPHATAAGTSPASGRPERVRRAEIMPKDEVYACGRLSGPSAAVAYRTADEGFVLSPWSQGPFRKSERMLISSERLEERHVRRAKLHGIWTCLVAVALVFANGICFGHYWMKALWGRPVVASATSVRTYTTSGKHGPVRHYAVNATASLDGEEIALTSPINLASYTATKAELGAGHSVPVPFVIIPKDPSINNIGSRPALWMMSALPGWTLFAGLLLGYALHTRHARPWYERKRVVDRGKGPLGAPDSLA